MIWNRGGKSCMWFCVFICTIFYLWFDGFYSNELCKRMKKMCVCNERSKQHTQRLTCIANIREWRENVDLKSRIKVGECVLGEKSKKREKKCVHLKHGMASLHDVAAALRFFSCSVCAQRFELSHSWISFRNHKNKFHLWNYDMAYQQGIEAPV